MIESPSLSKITKEVNDMKKEFLITTILFLLFTLSSVSLAFAWEYPVIKSYGPVQPLPDSDHSRATSGG
jgi:hypothetical protein